MKIKIYLLLFLVSLPVDNIFAFIAVGEKLEYKLLFVEKKIADVSVKSAIADYRYIVLNRGTTDGVYESDHFSFYRNGKFAFRGVVVKSESFKSMWLTYHNYTPALLELNSKFIGKKINFGHVPKRVSNLINVLGPNVEDVYSSYISKPANNKKGGGSNLPISKNNETIQIVDKNDLFEFNPDLELDEIIKASQSDVDYFSWYISASPISFSRVPETKDLGYSISISCLVCEDTSIDFSYSYTHSTEKPAKSDFSDEDDAFILTSSSYQASLDFNYNNFWGNVSYWASLSWARARTADVVNNEPLYSPDYLWSGIPFGLSYNFISTDKIPEFSISYGLQWDLEKVAFIDFAENEFGEFVDVKAEQKTQKTRHSIKLYFYWIPFENFSFTNTFWYKPLHDFSNKEFDWRDSGPFTNNLSISYKTSLDVSLTYTNDITWDVITKERDGTPSTNMINSFEVTYNFNF